MDNEPGRRVTEDGRITYAWPPVGRFAALWRRIEAALPYDEERLDALALLARWDDETAQLVGYLDDDEGGWVDVEPDWRVPADWLDP